MNRFTNRLATFMMGRSGMDALNVALLGAAVVVSAIGVFVRDETAFTVLRVLSTLLLLFAVWRMFSRKLDKRRGENARFLALTAGPRTALANLFCRDRTHKFFTCPSCRSRLRVPAGKGKLEITCPSCGTRFSGKS